MISVFWRFLGFLGGGGVSSSASVSSSGGGGAFLFLGVGAVTGVSVITGGSVIAGGGSGSVSTRALFFAPGGRPLPRLAGTASSGRALEALGLSGSTASASTGISAISAIY